VIHSIYVHTHTQTYIHTYICSFHIYLTSGTWYEKKKYSFFPFSRLRTKIPGALFSNFSIVSKSPQKQQFSSFFHSQLLCMHVKNTAGYIHCLPMYVKEKHLTIMLRGPSVSLQNTQSHLKSISLILCIYSRKVSAVESKLSNMHINVP
jgi:hypothetical protein